MFRYVQPVAERAMPLAPAVLSAALSLPLTIAGAGAAPHDGVTCPVPEKTVSTAVGTEVRGLGLFPGDCMYATRSDESRSALAVTIRVRTSADFKNGVAMDTEKAGGALYNSLGKHLNPTNKRGSTGLPTANRQRRCSNMSATIRCRNPARCPR